jgi:predicted ATPase
MTQAQLGQDDLALIEDGATPPFLRRVSIRGYKSIAFCDVALEPLTILVGRNSSGKSNFLDALAFLRDAMVVGLDEAVSLHGGRKAILPRSSRGSVVSFELELNLLHGTADGYRSLVGYYNLSVKIPVSTKPFVKSERMTFINLQNKKKLIFDRKGEQLRIEGEAGAETGYCSGDELSIHHHSIFPYDNVWEGFHFSAFYNFSPDEIRKLQKVTNRSLLKRDGRNIAEVIRFLESSDRDVVDRVRAYLSTIVDEIEGFTVARYGEYETVRFLVRSGSGKTVSFDAASMSEGTLRALAILVAAFHARPDDYILTVVGIEEPETALHPAALRALANALEEASGQTQIILTTHSAEILGDRDIHPSQILIVRNRDGQTQITPVDAASREIIEKELYSLAELQRQDLLDLDEADLRRQADLRSGSGGT